MVSPFACSSGMERAFSPRASNATRQAATLALVQPDRGSCRSKNSSSPRT